jgi:hypothetical protein
MSVPASSTRNTASNPLVGADKVAEILMTFPAGTALNLQYRFFLVATAPTSNSTVPVTGEITYNEVPVGYFVGDNLSFTIPFQYTIPQISPIFVFVSINLSSTAFNAAIVVILEASA